MRIIVLAGAYEELPSQIVGMADLIVKGMKVVKTRDGELPRDAYEALRLALFMGSEG